MLDTHITIINSQGTPQLHVGSLLSSVSPTISLDTLFWQPNRTQTPVAGFRAKIAAALTQNAAGWVLEGRTKSFHDGYRVKHLQQSSCVLTRVLSTQ
jgi:hypothetical protein